VSDPHLSRTVLSDQTYTAIRDLVLNHEIAPSTRVNIDTLSTRLGVSPTPVREALARLESDSLVVKTPLRGYSTTPLLTSEQFWDLVQFRIVIEGWTASEASRSASPEIISELREELATAKTVIGNANSDPMRFQKLVEHDSRFHALIARAAGNVLVNEAFERTHFHLHFLRLYLAARGSEPDAHGAETRGADTTARTTAELRNVLDSYHAAQPVTDALAGHTEIVDAISSGEAQHASHLMQDHIKQSAERFNPIVSLLSSASHNT